MSFFDQSIQYLSLKSTVELCLMVRKIDAKFGGKVTCASKNDFCEYVLGFD